MIWVKLVPTFMLIIVAFCAISAFAHSESTAAVVKVPGSKQGSIACMAEYASQPLVAYRDAIYLGERQLNLNLSQIYAMKLSGDELLIGCSGDGVYDCDLAGGAVKWRSDRPFFQDLKVAGDAVYFMSAEDELSVCDLDSGVELGHLAFPWPLTYYSVFEGKVLACGPDNISVIDDGNITASIGLGGRVVAAPLADGDNIFVPTEGRLYALSPGFNISWEYPLADICGCCLYNGSVVVLSSPGSGFTGRTEIRCLAYGGMARWSINITDRFDFFSAKNRVLFMLSSTNTLYKIDLDAGVLEWSVRIPDATVIPPYVSNSGDVYIGGIGGSLYRVGETQQSGESGFSLGAPVIAGTAVIGGASLLFAATFIPRASRELLYYPLAFQFTMSRKEKVLKNRKRVYIMNLIKYNPGISLNELGRSLKAPPDSLRYHVYALERHGFIKKLEVDKKRFIFSSDKITFDVIPYLSSERERNIFRFICMNPNSTTKDVANGLGIQDRRRVNKCLYSLTERGLMSSKGTRGAFFIDHSKWARSFPFFDIRDGIPMFNEERWKTTLRRDQSISMDLARDKGAIQNGPARPHLAGPRFDAPKGPFGR